MIITSTGIPLPFKNIDTDQIIPAAFLKLTTKEGYGKYLFYNWRYLEDEKLNYDFVLNQVIYKSAQILIVGNNFGCGSSREHAAWALADYGIKVIISTQVADIHKENAYNNGIIPIELSKNEVDKLMEMSENFPECEIVVDLNSQTVTALKINLKTSFKINSIKKDCLLNGLNETQFLMKYIPEIQTYETK